MWRASFFVVWGWSALVCTVCWPSPACFGCSRGRLSYLTRYYCMRSGPFTQPCLTCVHCVHTELSPQSRQYRKEAACCHRAWRPAPVAPDIVCRPLGGQEPPTAACTSPLHKDNDDNNKKKEPRSAAARRAQCTTTPTAFPYTSKAARGCCCLALSHKARRPYVPPLRPARCQARKWYNARARCEPGGVARPMPVHLRLSSPIRPLRESPCTRIPHHGSFPPPSAAPLPHHTHPHQVLPDPTVRAPHDGGPPTRCRGSKGGQLGCRCRAIRSGTIPSTPTPPPPPRVPCQSRTSAGCARPTEEAGGGAGAPRP